MSLEKITSTILDDAQQTADNVIKHADDKCAEIISEAEAKIEKIEKMTEERSAAESRKLIAKKVALADIDKRKKVLQTKQELISECFERAIAGVSDLEKDDYMKFLMKLVKNTGMKSGEIVLNQKDAKEIGDDFVAAIAKEIEGSNIVLSKETRNIRGGFLLKKDKVYVNCTIEALVDEAKQELTGEVAAHLFG